MGSSGLWQDFANLGSLVKSSLLVWLGVLGVLLLGAQSTSDEAGSPPPAPSKPKTGRILLLGDSLMVGASPHVEAKNVEVAKVGMTLAEMIAVVRRMPAEGFDGVAISGGLNDLAMPSTGDQVASRASELWQLAKDKGWKVAHFALSPFGGGPYAQRMSELERRRANEQMRATAGSVSILPADDLLDAPDDPSRLFADFAAPDKLHLNPRGYKLLASLVDEWVRTRL